MTSPSNRSHLNRNRLSTESVHVNQSGAIAHEYALCAWDQVNQLYWNVHSAPTPLAGTGTTTDTQGNDSYNLWTQAWLTTAKINATTIQVSASRANTSGGTSTIVSYETADLLRTQVDSVQRGMVRSGGTAAFTACPSGTGLAFLTWLGTSGFNTANNMAVTASTTITSGGAGANTIGWQIICWK
jgi:hypothetical protein